MTDNQTGLDDSILIQISPEEFAALGSNAVGYIRRMSGSEAQERFSEIKDLPINSDIFAVFRGDGTPLALTNNPQTALANIQQNNLTPVALH